MMCGWRAPRQPRIPKGIREPAGQTCVAACNGDHADGCGGRRCGFLQHQPLVGHVLDGEAEDDGLHGVLLALTALVFQHLLRRGGVAQVELVALLEFPFEGGLGVDRQRKSGEKAKDGGEAATRH